MTDYLIEFSNEMILAEKVLPGEEPSGRLNGYAWMMTDEEEILKEEQS